MPQRKKPKGVRRGWGRLWGCQNTPSAEV